MKKLLAVLLIFAMSVSLFGCEDEKQTDIPSETTVAEVTMEEVTTVTETAITTSASDEPTKEELPYLFSVDLNYDGITEDFFVSASAPYDKFKIIMYSDMKKTEKVDEIEVYRTEKLDVFNDGTYCFNCISEGNHNKSILIELIWTGTDECKGFAGTGYKMFINPARSCYVHNAGITIDEFNHIMTDNKNYLKKYRDMDYVETIDIGKLANSGRTETHIKDLTVCNGMKNISVSALENDSFGRKLKFTNGTCTYHSFDGDKIDVYKRMQKIVVFDGENVDTAETGEYEYLFCLKSPDNGTAELVYLGTPEESFIFAYECHMDDIENKVNSTLEKDCWEYVSTMDLK